MRSRRGGRRKRGQDTGDRPEARRCDDCLAAGPRATDERRRRGRTRDDPAVPPRGHAPADGCDRRRPGSDEGPGRNRRCVPHPFVRLPGGRRLHARGPPARRVGNPRPVPDHPVVYRRPGDVRARGAVSGFGRLSGDSSNGGRRSVALDGPPWKDRLAPPGRPFVGAAMGSVGTGRDRPADVAAAARLPGRDERGRVRPQVSHRAFFPQAPPACPSHVSNSGVYGLTRSACRGRIRAANPYRPLTRHGTSTR